MVMVPKMKGWGMGGGEAAPHPLASVAQQRNLEAIRSTFDRFRHLVVVNSRVSPTRFLSRVAAVPQTALHFVPLVWGY